MSPPFAQGDYYKVIGADNGLIVLNPSQTITWISSHPPGTFFIL